MSIFEHWKSPDGFFSVFVKDIQSFQVNWNVRAAKSQSQWKVCYFTLDFFKTHFSVFYFYGEPGTMKLHDA